MASAPSDSGPVLGRIDSAGRLVAADPKLERLQLEAGSSLGSPVALPQLANVARLAQRLRIPVSRRILAAGRDQDVDMWVRAVPEGDEIALAIEQWSARPPSPPRLAATGTVEHERLSPEPLSWSVDEHLRVVSVAPGLAELLNVEGDRAGGQPLTSLFRLEEGEDGAMPLLEALASRSGFSGQQVRVRDGGQEMVLTGEVTLGPDGGFAGFEGSATTGEAGPVPASPARPLVDGTIRTALRSPLDTIVRTAEEMVEKADSSGRVEYGDYAADIAAAARHLLSVMRSLGEKAEAPAECRADLAALALEAIGLVEAGARERNVIIGVERAKSVLARGDVRSIVQILVNLIGNAVRYSPQGTAVTLSFESSNNCVLVHVADEGPGIDPAHHQRIFEPFQKGSEDGDGSGLGLAIARRLAREMGGDIRLRSATGQGSRFSLELPAG